MCCFEFIVCCVELCQIHCVLFRIHCVLCRAVSLLPQAGADTESYDNFERTPVCSAAQRGCCECVSTLLDYQADPNISDLNGIAALIYACRSKDENMVAALLHAFADPNARTKEV